MTTIEKMEAQLSQISVMDAIEILCDLDHVDDSILLPKENEPAVVATPWDLLDGCDTEYPAVGCSPIIFCGGPPGSPFWYTGSLLTMVIDKFLYNCVVKDVKHYYYEKWSGKKMIAKVSVEC